MKLKEHTLDNPLVEELVEEGLRNAREGNFVPSPVESDEDALINALEDTENLSDNNFGTETVKKEELPALFEDAVPEYTKKEQHDPADLAATFFKMQAPRLDRLLDKMSAKQLRRLIFNAVSYPLVDRKYAPRVQEEKDAAYLVAEMVFNRAIMQLTVEMQKAQNEMDKQNNSTNTEDNVTMGKPSLNELIDKQLTNEQELNNKKEGN